MSITRAQRAFENLLSQYTKPPESNNLTYPCFPRHSLAQQIFTKAMGYGMTIKNRLEWHNKFYAGSTAYIHGIRSADLRLPIMWGVDPSQRLFLALHYVAAENGGLTRYTAVLFQRNPGDGELYMNASNHPITSASPSLHKILRLLEGKASNPLTFFNEKLHLNIPCGDRPPVRKNSLARYF